MTGTSAARKSAAQAAAHAGARGAAKATLRASLRAGAQALVKSVMRKLTTTLLKKTLAEMGEKFVMLAAQARGGCHSDGTGGQAAIHHCT